jgi:formylglycine-generating enzyme required for sulfatase activity
MTRLRTHILAAMILSLPIHSCGNSPTESDDSVLIVTPGGAEHVMMIVPEGEFKMGSETGTEDESPVHSVFLSEYLIDKFEVTNQKFVRFLNAIKRHETSDGNPLLYLENTDVQIFARNGIYQVPPDLVLRPVVEVTWWGAVAYCEWMGGRLPTEAQWEKAARGTDERRYPWGNETPDKELLNFSSNLNHTTDVGSYPEGASPYGALDMGGNVWEWTNDHYGEDYYAVSPSNNPTGPGEGEDRAIRGGGFASPNANVESAGRGLDSPEFSGSEWGFRCARDGGAP